MPIKLIRERKIHKTVNIDWSFPRQVLVALILIGGAGVYPLMQYGNTEIIRAAIAGAVISTINILLGFAAIEYSIGKSTTTFFKYVLGGIGVRMLFMSGVLVLLLNVFAFHTMALITSLGIFYVVYLTLEILYIQKKVSIKQQG